MRYQDGTVAHSSDAGEYTIELLNLNDPDAVNYRENVIHMIDVLEDEMSEIAATEKNIAKKLRTKTMTAQDAAVAVATLEVSKVKTLRALKQLCGTL